MRYLALILTLLSTSAFAQASFPPGVTSSDLSAAAASNLSAMQTAVPLYAPVKSVNTQTGVVVVPTFERKVGTLNYSSFTTTAGVTTGTWTYGSDGSNFTFSAPPKCFPAIRTSSSNVTYTFPTVTNVTASTVTFAFRVQPVSLSVLALGTVSLTATLPTDTAMDILCLNPI